MLFFQKYLFAFFIIIMSHTVLAQTQNNTELDYQKILKNNPNILQENPNLIDLLEANNYEENEIKTDIISNNQTVLSSNDLLNDSELYNKLLMYNEALVEKEIAASSKYFKTLTGELLNIYGMNEFSQKSDENLLFFNTVGDNYELAPGDVLRVTVRGLNSYSDSYQVNNDGTIILEDLYPVNVDGLTITQASDVIQEELRIDDAAAQTFVKLDAARLITVQISGNVSFPRTIAIPAYTPLSRAIAYSGGVTDNGSLRNIYISQMGEAPVSIDFYNFLKNPLMSSDPLITKSARIFVSDKGPSVAATGFFSKPGIYELPQDINSISAKDLLKLSGTSFIPPGATLRLLSFDNEGKINSRVATNSTIINEGEALKIDLVETRLLNSSNISGAVMEDYEIAFDSPLSIREILKGGSVLSYDAFKPFALILDDQVSAVNLKEALNDDSIMLPVGADLKVFNQNDYNVLVSDNLNDPLVHELQQSKLAQIYLDGKRIAFIPPSNATSFYESIRNFYIPNPKTSYEIAFLKTDYSTKSFSLKSAINNNEFPPISAGDILFIYENKFFENLLEYKVNSASDRYILNANSSMDNMPSDVFNPKSELDEQDMLNVNSSMINMPSDVLNPKSQLDEEYLERLSLSNKILQEANTLEIFLDGKLFSILPSEGSNNSQQILDILDGRLPKLVNEFVLTLDKKSDGIPKIKNLNQVFKIGKNEIINLISQTYYTQILNWFHTPIETNLLNNIRSSDAVSVYYDGKLALLLPPNFRASELSLFDQFYEKAEIYKLFISLLTRKNNNLAWDFLTFDADTFFSKGSKQTLGPANVVNLFSNSFIRKTFVNKNSPNLIQQASEQNGNDISIFQGLQNRNLNEIESKVNTDLVNISSQEIYEKNSTRSNTSQMKDEKYSNIVEIMNNKLRTISGSVQYPGTYPVADEIKLSDLISTAVFDKNVSDMSVVVQGAINKENRLIRANPSFYSTKNTALNKVILSGLYVVDVPYAINDAINGTIKVSGEILVPGNYSFTRTETLKDIIKRAGGLSSAAFPLGAVLQRDSIKEQEIATNNILANQLESGVLQIAQSDIGDAGAQIKTVLGFANQLRQQGTAGRLSINLMDDNQSGSIYLQDNDHLVIPKRPSHVSIVGAIQNTTVATYNPDYSFKEYVYKAGGFTAMADIRRSYVLLPNGESRLLTKDSIIPVGSVVVVPPKLDKISILGFTDIVSRVLGNIATSVLAINNVR